MWQICSPKGVTTEISVSYTSFKTCSTTENTARSAWIVITLWCLKTPPRIANRSFGKTSLPAKAVQEAFKDATSAPFSYLLLDFKQCTPDKLRLRTKVFPDETTVVYVPCWEQWRHGWTATHRRSNFFPARIKRWLKISLKVQVTTSSVFPIARSNVLKGNVCVSPKQKSKLTRHKKALRDLAKKKVWHHCCQLLSRPSPVCWLFFRDDNGECKENGAGWPARSDQRERKQYSATTTRQGRIRLGHANERRSRSHRSIN